MDNYFCVRMCTEGMPAGFELGAQLGKIVDFAVENHPDGAVFVMDRLASTRKIDNTEPAYSQPDCTFDIDSLIVWTAVHNGLTHAAHVERVNNFLFPPNHTCYAAHG